MSARRIFRYTFRWAVFGLIVSWLAIMALSLIIGHVPIHTKIMTNPDNGYFTIRSISAPWSAVVVAAATGLMMFLALTDVLSGERIARITMNNWEDAPFRHGVSLGCCGLFITLLAGTWGVAAGSFVTMLIVLGVSCRWFYRKKWKRLRDFWQVLLVPAYATLIVTTGSSIFQGAYAGLLYGGLLLGISLVMWLITVFVMLLARPIGFALLRAMDLFAKVMYPEEMLR